MPDYNESIAQKETDFKMESIVSKQEDVMKIVDFMEQQ